MRFNLKYQGTELPPNGSAHHKHKLRLHFHRQISRLWNADNRLKTIDRATIGASVKDGQRFDVQRTGQMTVPWNPDNPLSSFMFRHTVRDTTFIPLVTEVMGAECHLSIRIGRPVKPGGILYAGGDLDGRLKTLFDALRMAQLDQELPQDATAEDVLCLLADDGLITKLSIESYELLDQPSNSHHVDIDVGVTINAVVPMTGTAALLW